MRTNRGLIIVAVVTVLLLAGVTGMVTATTYYVSPSGDDSDPGTIDQPWQTIQHAADTLTAGDMVYIRSGTYNEHVRTMQSGNPTDGSIVFAAYPGETPIIDGTGVTEANNGVIVDQSYIRLIGLEICNWTENGIWAENAGYLEIIDCVVHDVGYGIGVADGTHDFALTRVEMHHFDYYGFDASPSGGADCYNGTFIACSAHTWRDPELGHECDGFALSHEGNQHDFVLNRCEAYTVGDGFVFGGRNVTVNRCSAHDAEVGYKVWGDNTTLVNCLSYHNENANVELDWDEAPGTTTLQNCDFVDTQTYNIWIENSGDSLCMYNCILAGGDTLGLAFEERDASNYQGDYNVFHNDVSDSAIVVGYEGEFSLDQIAAGAWTVYSGQDAHSLVAVDPPTQLFQNLAAWNFHLCEGSIAIDNGTAQGAPSEDFDGTPRPQGAGYDIGCYEFSSSPSTPSTYYVAPTGNDSHSGTIDQPWQTIQHAADTLTAGDTAYIRGGTYNEHVHTVHSGNATDGYIVFAAYPGETPVLDGTGVTESSNGIIVDQSYIKLIGLEICNWTENGIWAENAGYLEIADCEVHQVWYGIGFADGTHDFALNRVEMHHFDLYGFDASPSGGADCYNGTFTDCVAHTGRDPAQNVDGFALGHGTQHDFVFNRCEVYDVFDGFDISARNTTLNRCSAHECWNGGYKLWQDNVTLVNCLGYHNEVSNVELDWDGDPGTTTLQNCDFVDAQTFNIWIENAGDSLRMYNCILAGGDNIGLAFEQRDASNYQGDHNIFHNDNADRAIAVGYEDEFTLNQIAAGDWTTYSGQDAHSLVAVDPPTQLFQNLAAWDFHLCEESIAIDNGTAQGAPPEDFDGTPRPQGVGYDLGCYEFIASSTSSFDRGQGTYPSIAGTHNGTITPDIDLTVSRLYTYPCEGTGGHTEYVKIWNESGPIAEGNWTGYDGDWHNITFDTTVVLYENETYNYTIRTGSYPQIIHAPPVNATGGTITCEEFVDVNGIKHEGWIPAIRLGP